MKFKPASISIPNDRLFESSMPGMIWRTIGRHQIAACVLAICVALLHIAPIEIQRRAMDEAIPAPDLNLLLVLSLAYLGLVIAYQLAKFILNSYQNWIGESVNQFLRHRIIGTEKHKSSPHSSEIASVMVDETAQFGEFVGEGISEVCIDFGMLVGVLAYMFWVEPQIAAIAMLLLVPQAIVTPYMQTRLNSLIDKKIHLKRELGRDVVGNTTNFEEAGDTTHDLFHNNIQFAFMKFFMKACLGLMSAMGPVLIIGVGGYYVIHGQTTIGVVVAFLSGFSKVQEPIRGVITFYRSAAQAGIRHELIIDWLKSEKAGDHSIKK